MNELHRARERDHDELCASDLDAVILRNLYFFTSELIKLFNFALCFFFLSFVDRIGLSGFDNPMRDPKTEELKRHVGQVCTINSISFMYIFIICF